MTTAAIPRIDADWINQPCDENRTYGGPEAATLAGVTYRQLDHWIGLGLLSGHRNGTGNRRRFTLDDLEVIHATGALVNAGFIPGAAFTIAEAISRDGCYQATHGDIYRVTIEAVAE